MITFGLDIVLAIVLVSYAVIGYRHGFVVSVMSLVGFLAGGALGMWLLPMLLRHWDTVDNNVVSRTVVLILGVFAFAAIGQSLAVALGSRMRSGLQERPERIADSALGAVATVVAVSVLIWFLAGAVRGGAQTPLTKAIGSSRIVSTIDRFVPPQTARLFAGFQSVLDREGFPRVFEGVRAEPIAPIAPPDSQLRYGAGVARAGRSIVKITGVASSCNREQEGSGWVVAPERVVTNAHVVAGTSTEHVRIQGAGRSYDARVVVFDPKRDLAVLSVPGLPAPASAQGSSLRRSGGAVVAGFPLNGPYRLDAARVRDVLTATGSDIYGSPGAVREVYSLYARIQPGNSGGPLLSPAGAVVGIVFARSLDDDRTGYALTLDEARPVLDAATRSFSAVSTGDCVAG
ncbi:MAG TPA: MarP family serine protease [Dermatophilaceae bacterium]|jgi:S1-C subfamily serine protease